MCLAFPGIILKHLQKDQGERQIGRLRNPDDSRICKFMQMVVNLPAVCLFEKASRAEPRQDAEPKLLTRFGIHLCATAANSDGAFVVTSFRCSGILQDFFKLKFFVDFAVLQILRRKRWRLLHLAELLQDICQSKHSCKCYGKMLCVALPLKENTTNPA